MSKTIDEVIQELEYILSNTIKNNNAVGFFSVLYLRVTKRIKEGIEANEFEDNERMEKLDVIFANRFIEAFYAFERSENIADSWDYPFRNGHSKKLLILQHMLMGINVHINLDLGIAASETVENDDLNTIKNDFNKINDVLSELIDEVEDKISKVSPLFKWLDKLGGRMDEKLVAFSINIARDGAWKFAQDYHLAQNKQRSIDQRDQKIAVLSVALAEPKSKWFKLIIRFIRFFEKKDNRQVIEALK